MKDSCKLSIGFLCIFGIALALSINKGYSFTISHTNSKTDLQKLISTARTEGFNVLIDKLNYENEEISRIEISISSESCQTSFLQKKSFKMIEISANANSPCDISFDVHTENNVKNNLSFISTLFAY